MPSRAELLRPLRAYGVCLRYATPEDAKSLERLGNGLNAHQGDPTDNLTSEVIARDLCNTDPEYFVILASIGDNDVGYGFFHTSYETAYGVRGFYVSDLYVDEAYRGRKVGKALVAAIVRHARLDGRTYLWWGSKEWNKDAQAVYTSWGATHETIMAHALFGAAFDSFDLDVETLEEKN